MFSKRESVKTKVFDVKAKAVVWAMHEEAAIIAGKHGNVPDKTFGELLERYANEMSVIKRGERLRIALTCREEIKQYQQKVTNANPGLESRSEPLLHPV